MSCTIIQLSEWQFTHTLFDRPSGSYGVGGYIGSRVGHTGVMQKQTMIPKQGSMPVHWFANKE